MTGSVVVTPRRRRSMPRALRFWRVRVGLLAVVFVVGLAIVGPALAPHGETEFVGPPNSRDVRGAVFGTDYLGQDVWSRFLLGGREILVYAVVGTIAGVLAGIVLGVSSALAGSPLHDLLTGAIDVMLAIPALLLALVAMTTVGPETWVVVVAVALVALPRVARVARGATGEIAGREFVVAARLLGRSRPGVAWVDILPNIAGVLLVEVSIRFAYAIGVVASLAFLGFAPSVNTANWGLMIQENRVALAVQPWGLVLPTAAIVMLTVGTGLIADGIARTEANDDDAGPITDRPVT